MPEEPPGSFDPKTLNLLEWIGAWFDSNLTDSDVTHRTPAWTEAREQIQTLKERSFQNLTPEELVEWFHRWQHATDETGPSSET